MAPRKHICFTFAGDIGRDSRLRRFTSTLAEEYRVSIVALCDTLSAPPSGVELHTQTRSHLSLRRSLPQFWKTGARVATELHADMYIAADLYTLPTAARAAKRRRAILAYDSRELYTSIAALQGRGLTQRFWTLLERVYSTRTSLVFTVNDSIAEILRQRGSRNVVVIRNLPDWRLTEQSTRLRDELGIASDTCILLSQGGLQRGRGVFTALRSLAEIQNCVLVFLGSGPLVDEMLAEAARLGIADRVFVLPAVPVSELPQWTASADIGLCLIEPLGESYRLSLPNKLFEYLAAGLPIIGSDLPEIGAVLRSTKAGIAIDPAAAGATIEALRLLVDDPALRLQYRENALAASVDFIWENEKHLLLSAVESALHG